MQDPFDITSTVQPSKDNEASNTSGNKRQHSSDTSDSDKDNGAITEDTQLALISATPTQGAWRKVKKNLVFLPMYYRFLLATS